jgi:hypothetical protein
VDTTSSPPVPPPSAPPSAAPANEEALDQLLRQIIEGFFVLTDGQGALSKWSEPAELLFGLEADEALMEPFFGKLVPVQGLTAEGEAWRTFLETGDTPGSSGCLRVDAYKPGGGTFPMEAVFVPVKLDEGFDFSLFLEDLGFELPIDMMLVRMRQQHPVVVRALRAALEPGSTPWDGVRTAGTLISFRALEPTPWMAAAMERREKEREEAEAELQSRIEMIEAPAVSGTDVYDLDDARAVIDRLRWATERIEELEERSRIATEAVQEAADARVRAEAAERAALDVRAEVSGVLAERPVDSSGEADRLELVARIERAERAAQSAAELATAQRTALEAERAKAIELEAQRAELVARLEKIESVAGTTGAAEAAIADARAELTARLETLERVAGGDAASNAELAAKLEAVERARAAEAAELRAEIQRLREPSGAHADRGLLEQQVVETRRLRDELEALRARTASTSAVMRLGEERESAAMRDAELARAELAAALERVEQLAEETARLRAHLDSAPGEAGLSPEDRQRLESVAAASAEAQAGLDAMRALADQMRADVQTRVDELEQAGQQARREQEDLRAHLEELRNSREDLHQQLREAARTAEEARALAARGPADGDGRAGPGPATSDEVLAAHARLDEVAAQSEALRADVAQAAEEAAEARRLARETGDRIDMVDRANQTGLAQVSTQAAIIEEIGALARLAQADASQSRADTGEARAAVARLEQTVAAAREQVEAAVAEAAGAREQAAAAGEAAAGVRELAAGVGDVAREAVAPVAAELEAVRAQLEAVGTEVAALQERPAGADPAVEAAVEQLRADVRSLRDAVESAEGGDAAAVQAMAARIDAIEEASAAVPKGLDARMDTLREGLANALGKLETVSVEMAATRTEAGAGRHAVEQRLADTAAELMAARTDAEQARRGLEGLQSEMATLREYAASAKAEAEAARDAVAKARRSGADRELAELRIEVQAALAKLQEMKVGFDEARQSAINARRDAEKAVAAAENAGAINVATGEKFTEVWQRMLAQGSGVHAAPRRHGSGVTAPGTPSIAKPKPKSGAPERAPQPGFDDDVRPLAKLDLKGKFKELNPGFSKLVGYQEHEFSKATWPSVLDREVYKEQHAELEAMAAGKQDRADVSSTYMHGQGLMVLVKGEVKLVRDDAGKPDHLLLVAEAGGPSA